MGQVGLEWQVVGFGPINGAGASDMLMRDTNNGAFEIYDISNNQITAAAPMGQVGMEWSVAGLAADPPGSANAQLAQAMASFAPGGVPLDSSSPLGQTAVQPNVSSLISTPGAQTPRLDAPAKDVPAAIGDAFKKACHGRRGSAPAFIAFNAGLKRTRGEKHGARFLHPEQRG